MTGPHKPRPIAAQIIDLAERGLHVAEIARRTGYSDGGVARLLERHNVAPGKCSGKVARPQNAERAERMASMYRQGLILEKIGQHFGVTRERVRQILKKMGITASQGGQSIVATSKRQDRNANMDARSLARWGISYQDMKAHRAAGLVKAYTEQRRNAHMRGVVWDIRFSQWLAVWIESGKLPLRGRGKGRYVMSRIKDTGGYVMGNVHIQLSTENNSEGIKRARLRKAEHTGVWLIYPGSTKPWQAAYGRHKLGLFETKDEAVAARAEFMRESGKNSRCVGYQTIKRGDSLRYRVILGSRYVGQYLSPEDALAARQSALAQPA